MRSIFRRSIPVMVIMLQGCVHFQQLEPTAAVSPTDAVVVLGISPKARVSVTAGEIQDSSWNRTGLVNAANVWSDDGFIVLRLTPRIGSQNYAVNQILPGGIIMGGSFVVKKGTSVPVFHAIPGKVTFVGAVTISNLSGKGYAMSHDFSVTASDAQDFIAKHYTNLPGPVETEVLEMMPSLQDN